MLNKKDQYVGPAELAKILSVPVSWCYSQARLGKLPCIKAGKYIRFSLPEVSKILGVGVEKDAEQS